jgi:hypothetical protein
MRREFPRFDRNLARCGSPGSASLAACWPKSIAASRFARSPPCSYRVVLGWRTREAALRCWLLSENAWTARPLIRIAGRVVGEQALTYAGALALARTQVVGETAGALADVRVSRSQSGTESAVRAAEKRKSTHSQSTHSRSPPLAGRVFGAATTRGSRMGSGAEVDVGGPKEGISGVGVAESADGMVEGFGRPAGVGRAALSERAVDAVGHVRRG